MKAVLWSISPEDCALIASGDKKLLITKVIPKEFFRVEEIEGRCIEYFKPFTVYVYCKEAKKPVMHDPSYVAYYEDDLARVHEPWGDITIRNPFGSLGKDDIMLNDKIIGEFVCNRIESFTTTCWKNEEQNKRIVRESCMAECDMHEYETRGFYPCLYALHISELELYNRPLSAGVFCKPCDRDPWCDCCECLAHGRTPSKHIKTPKTWCYVEQLSEKLKD